MALTKSDLCKLSDILRALEQHQVNRVVSGEDSTDGLKRAGDLRLLLQAVEAELAEADKKERRGEGRGQ